MNAQKMLLILPQKVELNPDFRADLVANWRFHFALRPSLEQLIERTKNVIDEEEVWDPKEAVKIVKTWVEKETLQDCASQFYKSFWNAYRAQIAVDAASRKKIKTTPPDGSNNGPDC